MTLQELYQNIGGDYDQAIRVLRVEKLIDKHIRKYPAGGVADAVLAAGEKMDVSVPGEALAGKNSIRLRWTERLEEDGGFSGETQAALQARDGHAMMQRKGPYAVSMVFAPGEFRETVYRTPYGELPLVIRAGSVHLAMRSDGGETDLDYDLQMQGGQEDHRRMRLTWRWADADAGEG